jgi:hypothetical protein
MRCADFASAIPGATVAAAGTALLAVSRSTVPAGTGDASLNEDVKTFVPAGHSACVHIPVNSLDWHAARITRRAQG